MSDFASVISTMQLSLASLDPNMRVSACSALLVMEKAADQERKAAAKRERGANWNERLKAEAAVRHAAAHDARLKAAKDRYAARKAYWEQRGCIGVEPTKPMLLVQYDAEQKRLAREAEQAKQDADREAHDARLRAEHPNWYNADGSFNSDAFDADRDDT